MKLSFDFDNRHVEMLRDDMSLQKKEMQTARADISNTAAITASIEGRCHMLDSELNGLSKKLAEHQAARDKAAASKPAPVMQVRRCDDHIYIYNDWFCESSCTVSD